MQLGERRASRDAPERGPGASSGASGPTWNAPRSAAAAASACASPRAWTMASGRSGPTCGADGRDAREPDGVVDRVVLARGGCRRAPVTARPTARQSIRVTQPGRSGAHRHDHRRGRQVLAGLLQQVLRAAEPGDHRRRSARRRRRSRAPRPRPRGPRPRRRPGRPARAAAPASASVTSCRRGSRAAPVRQSIASRTSTALPAVVAQHLVHVGDQRDGRQPGAAGHVDERARERLRVLARGHERARAGLDVHAPARRAPRRASWTGSRRRSAGSTRPCRWRRARAYSRRSAGARSAVWPTIAQPASRTTRRSTSSAGVRRVAGDRVELVQRAAGVAEPAAGDHRHRAAAGGEDRGEDQRHLVAHAAGRVLVDHRPVEVPVQHGAGVAHRRA